MGRVSGTDMRSRSALKAQTKTASARKKLSQTENISNAFLDNVRPIFQVLRIAGRFPYRISENEIKPFSMTSPIVGYSVLLFIVSLYMASIVLELLTKKLAASESYKDTLMTMVAIIYLIHYPLIPITDWLLAPTLIKYINLWHRYESEFKEEFAGFPNKYFIKYLDYSILPLSIYFSYYGAYELCDSNLFHSMIYFPLVHSLFQYLLLWVLCQFYLVRQIRKLKGIVISEGLQNRMERTRKCWLLLSELVSCTGYAIGVVLTSVGMVAFLGLIIYCYVFFTSLADSYGIVDWQTGLMVVFNLLIFFSLFDVGERTTKEVGRSFHLAVFNQKFSDLDEENLNQLVLLLTTFSLHPPIVRFAGLGIANRHLFVSFVSNTLTYLIVLVQFKNEVR